MLAAVLGMSMTASAQAQPQGSDSADMPNLLPLGQTLAPLGATRTSISRSEDGRLSIESIDASLPFAHSAPSPALSIRSRADG